MEVSCVAGEVPGVVEEETSHPVLGAVGPAVRAAGAGGGGGRRQEQQASQYSGRHGGKTGIE